MPISKFSFLKMKIKRHGNAPDDRQLIVELNSEYRYLTDDKVSKFPVSGEQLSRIGVQESTWWTVRFDKLSANTEIELQSLIRNPWIATLFTQK